jgi:hypothetical protein
VNAPAEQARLQWFGRPSWCPEGRLVQAEVLKLRARRGLLVGGLALTSGLMLARYGVLGALYAADSTIFGPAGGTTGLAASTAVLTTSCVVLAVITGALAGTADVDSGVFGDHVTTGRSRYALYAARVPGGLVFLAPLVAGGYAIAAAGSVLFAGYLEAPTKETVMWGMAWALVHSAVWFTVALGVASLVGSRTTAIAIVLGWQFVVEPVLGVIDSSGRALRYAGLGVALERLAPRGFGLGQPPAGEPSVVVAAVAVLTWIVVALAAGAWRTQTRDV